MTELEVFSCLFLSLVRSALLSFMIGVPKAISPFILGVPMPGLCLPLIGAPTTLFDKCASGVLRAKNGPSRPFLKVDEVELYPYYLFDMEFGS